MHAIRRLTISAILIALMLLGWSPVLAQPARTIRLVSPAQGEIVPGPVVTFRVEATGITLPDEHFHLFLDEAALRYVLGNPVPLGVVEFVHFRALTTGVRFAAGPHFVVLVATDAAHVPLRPLLVDSRYFFVQ